MAYLTKMQERERFLAEFLRRLRQAPPGTRIYMRVGDVFSERRCCQHLSTSCGPLARSRWFTRTTAEEVTRQHDQTGRLIISSSGDSFRASLH